MNVSEITYSKIDKDKNSYLLKALREVVEETNAHDQESYKEASWYWQYKNLPSKEALVYVASINQAVIGYYHIPVYNFIINNKNYRIGNVQSVAILKKFRRKGIFEKLSIFANQDAQRQLDLIYTFPNNKSIHTFIEYNDYKFIETLPTYVFPINPKKLINYKLKFPGDKFIGKLISFFLKLLNIKLNKNEIIEPLEIISDDNINLFHSFSNYYQAHLLRNIDFFNWKYLLSPKSKYQCFGLKINNDLMASVIVKTDKMFSNKGLIIMDYAYKNLSDFKKLLSNLHYYANPKCEKELSFILLCTMNRDIKNFATCGYIRIPNKYIPRKLNLLAKICNKDIKFNIKDKNSWLITMSDWDVL